MGDSKKKQSKENNLANLGNDRNKIFKSINDLLLQTSSLEFYKKFRSIMLDYFNPTCEDLNIIAQEATFNGNINDERITRYKVFNHLFNLLGSCKFIPETYFTLVNFEEDDPFFEEILMFWRITSRKVELKQILGFPMCVYSNRSFTSLVKNDRKYYMYFFKTQSKNTTSFYTEINKNENLYSEIFQKILIFFYLYQNGLTSQNYIFDEIESKCIIKTTFKVLDLIFVVPIKNIILLSPKTPLIVTKNPRVEDYFCHLEPNEIKVLDNISLESFPEFLITNFSQFFQKSIYNTKNTSIIAEMSQISINHITGKLYLVKKKDSKNYVYCFLLKRNTAHVTILYLFDSTIKNTLSLSTQTYNIQDLSEFVFYYPNFIFEDLGANYFIGSKN